jgi:NADPH2:quinone reductase
LAKEAGAKVVAEAGAPSRVEAAVGVGSDRGVNYRQSDLTEEVMALTDGDGVDVVFDNLGDLWLWTAAINSMTHGGRLLTVGTHAGDGILPLDVRLMYCNRLKLMSGLRSGDQPNVFFDTAISGVAHGRFRVLIDRVLPLRQVDEAFRLVSDNAVVGKVILDPTAT